MTIEAVPCPTRVRRPARLRYPDDDVLHLTAAEWTEFLEAVQQGDLDELSQAGRDHLADHRWRPCAAEPPSDPPPSSYPRKRCHS